MALDPVLFWSSTNVIAKNFIEVENADAYYKQASTGVAVDWKDVGYKALDESTFQVTCVDVYSAWDVMMNFYMRTAMVVKEDLYESCMSADRTTCDYGTTLEKSAFCGMYIITNWIKGAETEFKKNENYVHAERIKVDGIQQRDVADEVTKMEMFENGELDELSLGTNGMEKYGEDPRVLGAAHQTINEIQFNYNNPEKPYLADPEFRRAIFYLIDRASIAKLINHIPAPYFFGITNQGLSDGTPYRDTQEAKALVPENNGFDAAKANEILKSVFEKYKLENVELTLVYSDSKEYLRLTSEYIQSSINKLTDGKVTLKLQAMPSDATLTMMRGTREKPTNEYDMCWSTIGLSSELYKSWKRAERYMSTNKSAYAPYNNSIIDNAVNDCSKTENRLDDKKILALEVAIEAEMFNSMVSVPVTESQNFSIFSDRVVLPMSRYGNGIHWGLEFADLK